MSEKKKVNLFAIKSAVTLYEQDKQIISYENDKVKTINGGKFNFSLFFRTCLRDDKILEAYRKTPGYLNQK